MNHETTPSTPTGEVPFYKEKGQAVPRAIWGTFAKLRFGIISALLAWWYLAPYMRWDRGPDAPSQAILVDIAGRRAYFFDIEIWPQEVYYLTGLLLIAAISLFLMSSLAGRVWCGFLCWQPGFTDLFQRIERVILGDASTRLRRSRQSAAAYGLRQVVLYVVWAIVALITGISFTLWFGDAFEMWGAILTGTADLSVYVFIGLIGGMCFLLAGFARERVCVYMCPYSRFQSAMLDEHSLVVTYDEHRGEPRAPLKKGESIEGRGHCVDCKLCLHVCPTGVDIRYGNQLACIGCGTCVDACDSIMDRFGLPRGLVRFESSANMDAIRQGKPAEKHRIFRPRTLVYLSFLAVISTVMLSVLLNRSTLDLNILHERSPLYVELASGEIRNAYTVKVLNMERKDRVMRLETLDLNGAKLSVIGGEQDVERTVLNVTRDDVGVFRVYVTAKSQSDTRLPMRFKVTDLSTGEAAITDNVFMSPSP